MSKNLCVHNLRVNRKHSSSEILLILLAIRRNSSYQDNNEIKDNIVMFTYALRVILYLKCPILDIQNPKRRYNLKHCTLPLLHCGKCKDKCIEDHNVAQCKVHFKTPKHLVSVIH